MTTLNCMIVDDEPLAVQLLESYVKKTPGFQLVASFTDSISAINAIKEQKPHLVFLDIQMPNIDGMELAQSLPEQTRVVFTTAFKEYAFESYQVNAVDFLLKPIRYNVFLAAVEKVKKLFAAMPEVRPADDAKTSNSAFLRIDGDWQNISFDSIVLVNSVRDYVAFYLEGQQQPLITHLTMKAVEEMLPRERFLRVHRSYIVAVDKIRKIDRNYCIYIANEVIHVPDTYLPAFREFLERNSFNNK